MFNLEFYIPGLIIIGAVGLVSLFFLLGHPEITFAFFIFSYIIEGGKVILPLFNLTAILFIISFIGFLLPTIKGKPIHFSFKSSDFWLFLFLILCFGGTYLAPDPQDGVKKAALFFVMVFLPYLMCRMFFKTYEQIRVFLITILCLAITIAAILTVISFSGTYTEGRLQFFGANPIPTGTLLAIGVMILIIGLTSNLLSNSNKSKVFYIFLFLLCLYGIFLSGVRGPLLSAIIGIITYFVIISARRLKALLGVAVVTVLLLITFNVWHPYVMRVLPNIKSYSVQAIIQGLSIQQRLERYRIAIALFTNNLLFGVGTNGFSQWTGLDYPHNIFLEIGSENGLIGLIVFICFLGSVVLCGVRYLTIYVTRLDSQKKIIGLTILVLSLIILVEKQFSYSLTMHKDLFAFLGIAVNLPFLDQCDSRKAKKREDNVK